MITAGIDYGVRRVAFTFVEAHDDALSYKSHELVLPKKQYPPGEENDPDCRISMFEWVVGLATDYEPSLVVIESPIQGVSVNIKVGLRLAMVAGVLAVACSRAGSSTLSVGPTEWKKRVVGVGNADKDAIRDWLTANHPGLASQCPTQDSIDAACMALFAQTVLGG